MTTMPVDKGFYVSSKFGMRTGQYAGMHWGTDFGREGGSGGRPVYAVKDGTVAHSGPATGFGRWVTVDHPASNGGGFTVYGHIIPEAAVGQRVSEGQRIARIDPNSATNGGVAPHLHLEWHRYVWSQPGPDRLDPEVMLRGAGWPGEKGGGMDAAALAQAMGCSRARAEQMLPGYIGAMRAANITNVNRAAMFAAQIGHESVGLQYMEEIASGAAYEWRQDLGNVHPGDGVRFKGSGPIQLTGRNNFRAFTRWSNAEGHTDIDFEAHPHLVRSDPRWGFLAASWYWVVARPNINPMSDARDLEGVTRAINGGLNGLADRRERYNRALSMGDRLMPPKGDWFSMATKGELEAVVYHCLKVYVGPLIEDVKTVREQLTGGRDLIPGDPKASFPGWEQLGQNADGDNLTVTDAIAATRRDLADISKKVEQMKRGR